MKKFLLSLAAAAFGLTAMAGTASVTFSEKYSANTELDNVTVALNDEVSVTFAKGSGSTKPQYYANGTAVRCYGGNTFTVSASENITEIVLGFGGSDGSNAITANEGTYSDGTWTGEAQAVTFTIGGTSGHRRLASITVTYGGEGGSTGGGGTTEPDEPDQPDQPDQPGDENANVKQDFTTGIGLAEGPKNAPAEPTDFTATDTGITYTMMGTYVNNGYLMVAGKNTAGAYISWTLDFDMSQLVMTTSSGGSTNANSKVNVYANDQIIEEEFAVNAQNATYTIDIPEAYQAAGTVYKVESATTQYNQQFASFTYVRPGNEGQGGGETPKPEVPDAPEGVITVAQALSLLADGYEGDATVKGIISEISDMSNTDSGSTYGNATYYIKDALTDNDALEVFRGYWLNGEKFATGTEIAVGGTVTVEGKLINYNGTYEFTSGSKVVAYEAPNGDVPVPPTPEVPEGTAVTFNFTDPSTLGLGIAADDAVYTATGEYVLAGQTVSADGVAIEFSDKGSSSTNPRLYNSNGNIDLRLYKDQSFEVGVDPTRYHITGIEFTKAAGNFDMTPVPGTLTKNGSKASWTPATVEEGMATADETAYSSVIFNITGTTRISTMTVYFAEGSGVTAGIDSVDEITGEAIYFNLQGQRVANPDRGIFIKVEGSKATKVVK